MISPMILVHFFYKKKSALIHFLLLEGKLRILVGKVDSITLQLSYQSQFRPLHKKWLIGQAKMNPLLWFWALLFYSPFSSPLLAQSLLLYLRLSFLLNWKSLSLGKFGCCRCRCYRLWLSFILFSSFEFWCSAAAAAAAALAIGDWLMAAAAAQFVSQHSTSFETLFFSTLFTPFFACPSKSTCHLFVSTFAFFLSPAFLFCLPACHHR